VRRIEAVSGRGALALLRAGTHILTALREQLRCKDAEVLDRIQQTFSKTQNLEKSLQSVKLELATLAAAEILNGGINVAGVNLSCANWPCRTKSTRTCSTVSRTSSTPTASP
jgi:Alanyl-tRNA synthetase